MAFVAKFAEENYFNSLPSNVTDAFLRDGFNAEHNRFETLSKHFAFALKPSQRNYLNDCGIQLAPIASKTHPHPVSKTIENHLLYCVVSNMISNFKFLVFLSIKESKAEYIWNKNTSDTVREISNRVLDIKDAFRYSPVNTVNGGLNNFSFFCANLARRFNSRAIKPDCFFIHDEVHFWSPSNLCEFLFTLEPKNVLATVVIPPELIEGLNYSFNSVAYDFVKVDGNLFFFPDKSKGKPYQQPIDPWLLRCNKISMIKGGETFSYSIGLLESVGANHLFSFQRNKVVESVRFFNDFDCLDLRNLLPINVENKMIKGYNIRTWVFKKILSYIVCLKKGDSESSLAKLRQLSDSSPSSDELLLIGDFFDLMTRVKIFNKRSPWSFLSDAKNYVDSWVIQSPFLRRIFPVGSKAITELIRDWIANAESLKIQTTCSSLVFSDSFEPIRADNLPSVCDGILESVYDNFSKTVKACRNWLICPRFSGGGYSMVSRNGKLVDSMNRSTSYSLEVFVDLFPSSVRPAFYSDSAFSQLESFEPKWNYLHGSWDYDQRQLRLCYESGLSNDNSESVTVEVVKTFSSEPKDENMHLKSNFLDSKSMMGEPSKKKKIEDADELKQKDQITRKNACFFNAVGETIGVSADSMINKILCSDLPALKPVVEQLVLDNPISSKLLEICCVFLGYRVHIYYGDSIIKLNDNPNMHAIHIGGKPGHLFCIQKEKVEIPHDSQLKIPEMGPQAFIGSIFSKTYGMGSSAPIHLSEIDITRALTLIAAFESMNLGIRVDRKAILEGNLISNSFLAFLKSKSNEGYKTISIQSLPVYPFIGFAGSGKSFGLIEKLIDGDCSQNFMFTAPRKKIIGQVHDKIDSRQYEDKLKISRKKNFSTFENTLLSLVNKPLIVMDECSLNPPGFIDLVLLKSLDSIIRKSSKDLNYFFSSSAVSEGIIANVASPIACIAATGDILQSSFYSESCGKLMQHKNDLKTLCALSHLRLPYLFGSKRFGYFNGFIKLGYYNQMESKAFTIDNMETLLKAVGTSMDKFGVLVTSRADKSDFELDFPNVCTINESQGSTFNSVILIVTRDFFSNPIESIIVAITRHQKNLLIYFPAAIQGEMDFLSRRFPIHSSVVLKNFSVLDNLIKDKLNPFQLIQEDPFGHDFEVKLEGDPFLKSELSLVNDVKLPQIEKAETEVRENLKTHLPISYCGLWNLEISEMRARENREFKKFGVGWSKQFKDEPNQRDQIEDNCAMLPEAVFPRHFANDDLTFWSAVKKRLVFKNPLNNVHDFEKAKPFGKEMLDIFLKKVPLIPSFDQRMYEESISEFEEKKISKNAAMIGAHHDRSTTDWPINEIFLFIKSQLCTKKEKMFCDAKAGQTLACFSHLILCKFAPLNRYIEKKVTQCLPGNFYIHQKKNFDELEKWVKSYDFSGVCTESDYEAYDASQDSYTLAFEYELMKYLGVSNSMIEDYLYLKMHLNCKLGNLAIMRFTGEFCTFLFNTLTNMLFTFMKYDVRKTHAICFAGDDMCANVRLPENLQHTNLLKKFSLKAKVDFTRSPTFCGWNLSRYGIVKKPELIAARLAVAKQKGEVNLVLDSYFLEHLYAYNKGDHLFEILSEKELEHHYNLTRFFVKHGNLLKGESKKKFMETKEIEGGLFGECEFGNDGIFRGYMDRVKEKVKIDQINGEIFKINSEMNKFNPRIYKINKMSFVTSTTIFEFGHVTPNEFNQLESLPPQTHWPYDEVRTYMPLNLKNSYESRIKSNKILSILRNQKSLSSLESGSNLGSRVLGGLKIFREECLSYQSRSFSKGLQEMNQEYSLTQFVRRTFTVMRMPLTPRCLLLLKDFSLQLLYLQAALVKVMLHSSISLMKLSLRLSRRPLLSTRCFILEQSSYVLHAFSSSRNQSMAGLCTLIQGSWTNMMHAKRALVSNCKRVLPITFIGQIIRCPHMIQTCIGLLESSLNSMQSMLLTIPTCSSSILESCTNLATKALQKRQLPQMLGRSFKHFLGLLDYQILNPFSRMKILSTLQLWLSSMLVLIRASGRVVSSKVRHAQQEPEGIMPEVRDRVLNQSQDLLKKILNSKGEICLGQIHVGLKIFSSIQNKGFQLIKNSSTNLISAILREGTQISHMALSIVEQNYNEIRRGLGNYIWENMIDPRDLLHLTAKPAVEASEGVAATPAIVLSENQRAVKNTIRNYYLRIMFGNLAVMGTSEQTDYPGEHLAIPRPVIENQEALTAHLPAGMSLLTFATNVKAWGVVGAEGKFAGLTFRQLCEPFAEQAYNFFRENHGAVSFIYLKNPGAYFNCPAVVFDFNKGLPLTIIKIGKNANAISACNQRLFNREGKKAVFAAQGEVNLSFDA
uniref:Polyprotein n=1 Tax=Cherry virus A TaxID=42882 RepID=A0A1X9RTQ7_9VIRU|nr:polyprotein [Cherry virus A]